ncbi:hypothetical protein CLIM01_01007 [Colletotrichum limetticola]|uniref:Uncharacterized protein n=1 Tax=Colletotrichum limetticola TaxID=1209924 RepID=A0ABQ9QDC6_9PEZI|nr:hypothetical protein CLIM01_01007 [Colletotrichum limetticola]
MLVSSLKTIVTLSVALYATAVLAAPNVQMGADVQDLSESKAHTMLEHWLTSPSQGLGDTIEARGKPPRRPNNNNNNRRPGRNGKPRRPPK